MASKAKEKATPTALETEKIIHLQQSDIFADYNWNCRKDIGREDKNDDGKDEENSFKGLRQSILSQGQNDPVVVRPKRRSKTQYELVCGFRRYAAIEEIYKAGGNIPKLESGAIRCVIRELTDREARVLNGAENTARKNLNAPDTALLVGQLAKDGLTDNDIGNALGKSFGYVGKLHRIYSGTVGVMVQPWPDKPAMSVFDYWRQFPGVTTVDKLDQLQKEVQEEKRGDAFLTLIRPAKEVEKDPITGMCLEGAKVAKLLTLLHKNGIIKPGSGEFDWFSVFEIVQPKKAKKLDTQAKRNRVAKAMKDASDVTLTETESTSDEGEDEDEDTEDEQEHTNPAAPSQAHKN
jgi:ParB/RepB/Spo0J family partition protein